MSWWHRLLHPHCPDCIQEKECKSCETLKFMLEQVNFEKKQLLESILQKPEVDMKIPEELKPIQPRTIPWRARQQFLEAEDRKAAELLKKKQVEEEINKLEEKVGLTQEK